MTLFTSPIFLKQKLVINAVALGPPVADVGVPQGCVLGQTLFNLYIIDTYGCLESWVGLRLYADDALNFLKVERLNYVNCKNERRFT